MTLLYNLVLYSDHSRREKSPLWVCIVLNVSYLVTSFLALTSSVYLLWVIADLVTIWVLFFSRPRHSPIPAMYYCVFALAVNALLHITIYIDLTVLDNLEPWWFWVVYPIGVNISDFIIILALVINRDFLGICALMRFNNLQTIKQ